MTLTPQIEDLTNAIESLPALLNAVSALPTLGWLVIVALFLLLLANKSLPPIMCLIQGKKRLKLDQLDAYISSPNTSDPALTNAIRDIRNAHYFKIATSIYAEDRVRNAFIKLHETTSHLITWRHIYRAHPFLIVAENETVKVRQLSWQETLGHWYNQVLGYFFLLLTAILFSLVILSGSKTLVSFILGFGGGTITALIAMFIFSQSWPIHAARTIAKEIESQRSTSTDA